MADITRIVVYNRSDSCCTSRLNNAYVLVSDYPFEDRTLEELLQDTTVSSTYVAGAWPASTELDIQETGRYVRVQLSGSDRLSLAEVEVFGVASTDPVALFTNSNLVVSSAAASLFTSVAGGQ